MSDYLQNLVFSLEIIAPIFLMVFLGIALRRFRVIDARFVNVSSRMVYIVALPTLLFMKIAAVNLTQNLNWQQILYVYVGTAFLILMFWLGAYFLIGDGRARGVFIQGSFRGNFGIIGLAITANLFGNDGLGRAALLLAFIVPLYNIASVLALMISAQSGKHNEWRSILWNIAKNPLILAVVVAVPFGVLQIKLPAIIETTGDYIVALTLPMALISIGGSLKFSTVRASSGIAIAATLNKLILAPLLLTPIAYWIGLRDQDFVILFILFACPTAAASFIMAETMVNRGELASRIIVLTTIGSIFSIGFGLFLLKTLGLF